MKAQLAIVLGKTYRHEGQLSWRYLTTPETVVPDRQDSRPREGRLQPSKVPAFARRRLFLLDAGGSSAE